MKKDQEILKNGENQDTKLNPETDLASNEKQDTETSPETNFSANEKRDTEMNPKTGPSPIGLSKDVNDDLPDQLEEKEGNEEEKEESGISFFSITFDGNRERVISRSFFRFSFLV